MAKFLKAVLAAALAASLCACSAGQTVSPDVSDPPSGSGGGQVTAPVDENWPDNEFTAQIPKPGFPVKVTVSGSDSDGFVIVFEGASTAQIKEYVESVKKAGFTLRPDTTEYRAGSTVYYHYEARNEAGYEISVFTVAGRSGLSIEKH